MSLDRLDYSHLNDWKINKMLRTFSEFCLRTFRVKDTDTYDYLKIQKLGRKLGLRLNLKQMLEEDFKNKEFWNPIKEKILYKLWETLNQENDITSHNTFKKGYAKNYKFYVGKGNNSHLIRNLMNQRWWWQSHSRENMDELNFLWTQWKVDSNLDKLPSKFPKPEVIEIEEEKEDENISEAENEGEKEEVETLSKEIPKPKAVAQYVVNLPPESHKWYNRIEDNFNLTAKKYLYINMKKYYDELGEDVFSILPVTFHIERGEDDPEFHNFTTHFQNTQPPHAYIIKPGENSNRGHGIAVSDNLDTIKSLIATLCTTSKRTCIIQEYISNPLLINRRKFDIRIFTLLTCYNQGYTKGYYYNEGYLRTSCKEFSLEDLGNSMIHLTNDAVQKYDEDYGKYELANKLSYDEFQKYLDANYEHLSIDFRRDLLPQIRLIITDTMKAAYGKIDPYKRENTFEIMGYDFMIDEDFKIYLIEINTNPWLDQWCPLLSRLIPSMLENAFLIGLDPLFIPPEGFMNKKNMMNELWKENKFELIFDSRVDG
jgi:tubulin---tyrosine ligase